MNVCCRIFERIPDALLVIDADGRIAMVNVQAGRLSGHTDDPVVRATVPSGETTFLQKPFRAVTLARKLNELLDSPGGRSGGAW